MYENLLKKYDDSESERIGSIHVYQERFIVCRVRDKTRTCRIRWFTSSSIATSASLYLHALLTQKWRSLLHFIRSRRFVKKINII